jgi:GrpB-like predicted nucleotidyltransferase (UPF0157 family)
LLHFRVRRTVLSDLNEWNHDMASEEQIQAVHIGGQRPHNAPIRLIAYSAERPATFIREADRVRATLGRRALMLEHVGSTSVPGLAAKPIVDMILAVADSADEPAYVPAMESAGYVLHIREPDWHQHRLFKGPDADINLHVYSFGCPEIDKMLMFRDWLRSNDADRELYERTKRELAKQTWKYVQNYADAKTAVVEEIVARARARAARTRA